MIFNLIFGKLKTMFKHHFKNNTRNVDLDVQKGDIYTFLHILNLVL